MHPLVHPSLNACCDGARMQPLLHPSSLTHTHTRARAHPASILLPPPASRLNGPRRSPTNRYKVLKQKGVTIWMTGLSGSGKTTISKALEKRLLLGMGKNVYNIDGDNLRTGLTRDLGFSPEDRGESVRRAAEVAQLFSEAGVITMVTLTA